MLRLSALGVRRAVGVTVSSQAGARLSAPLTASGLTPTSAGAALLIARRAASSQQSQRRSSRATATPRVVDHYQRLGVAYEATPSEIKAAYRTRALECHPDVVDPQKRGEAEVLFRSCAESFEVLFDPTRRKTHDQEIGVEELRRQRQMARQRRDRQKAASTASTSEDPAQAGYRASSFGSAFARDAQGVETDEERAYYTRATQATSQRPRRAAAEQADQEDNVGTMSRASAAARRRRPFVRGDADRVFRDAFEGKSLDQILFETQRRRRQQATTSAASQAVAAARGGASTSSSSSSSSASSSSAPAGREEVLRRVMESTSERYAQQIQRQYGPGMLQHVQARRAPWEVAAETMAAPPAAQMPFRPFVNSVVPEGVSTPALPTLGPIGSTTDGTVSADDIELSAVHDKAAREELERLEAALAEANAEGRVVASADLKRRLAERRKAFGMLQYTLSDGTLVTGGEALNRVTKHIDGAAHNMGQLYSFHRPY